MSTALLAATICFIACHGGPAHHFAVFAQDLLGKGYRVEIYASGPALTKLQNYNFAQLQPFSLEDEASEERVAIEIAKKCAEASVVITDIGHTFATTLQKALAANAPKAMRIAYYDNPESYVPGYSQNASPAMQAAHVTLFANANLAHSPLYQTPSQEIVLSPQNKVGLGFYPLEQAGKLANRRIEEYGQIRARFFAGNQIEDRGQKVLVYAGGNNEEYFSKAFPACLQFFTDLSRKQDLTNYILLLQQHPGAKAKNRDGKLVQTWIAKCKANAPVVLISDRSTEDALVLADAILYYQTSMGPQFVLARIPTIQIGHELYQDILVRNSLCLCANSADELALALKSLQKNETQESTEIIEQGLGIDSAWSERLEQLIKKGKE